MQVRLQVQVVVVVMVVQLLLLLLLLLLQQLLLTEVKVERSVHAELVFDDFVDVAVLESALQRVQVQVQVVGHGPVVVEHAHQLAHHLRRCGRRVVLRTGAAVVDGHTLGQGGAQQAGASAAAAVAAVVAAVVGRRGGGGAAVAAAEPAHDGIDVAVGQDRVTDGRRLSGSLRRLAARLTG